MISIIISIKLLKLNYIKLLNHLNQIKKQILINK